MPLATTTTEIANKTAETCRNVSFKLAKKADHAETIIQLLRVLSLLVGVVAFLSQSVPDVSAVTENMQQWITTISAITLVVGSLVYMVVGKNPPERLRDYAHYIEGYANRLQEIIADGAIPDEVKNVRIIEIVRLANFNLQAVKSNWPSVMPQETFAKLGERDEVQGVCNTGGETYQPDRRASE